MNSRFLSAFLLAAAFAIPAAAQSSTPCTVTSSPLPVRSDGVAELTGDVLVSCPSYNAGTTVFTLTFNAPVTSRATGNGFTEALVLGTDASSGAFVASAFGSQNSSTVLTFSFFADFVGAIDFRFTNLRVDASGATNPITATVTATPNAGVVMQSNPTVVVANPNPSHTTDVRTCDDSGSAGLVSFQQNTPHNAGLTSGGTVGNIDFNVRFTEGFSSSFKIRIASNQDPSTPGVNYFTESGYVNTSSYGSQVGVADSPTLLVAEFLGIPANTQVWVTTNPLSGASSPTAAATLVDLDALGNGTGAPIGGSATGTCATNNAFGNLAQLNVQNGTATAVWRIDGASSAANEKLSFGVAVAYSSPQPSTGTASVTGMLAPNAANTSLPIPRFAPADSAIDAFSIVGARAPLSFQTASPLPNGTVGKAYSTPLAATGGVPPYAFSLVSTTTPFPVTISPSGVVTANPTQAGTYQIVVNVRDSAVSNVSGGVTKTFDWTVVPPLAFATTSPLPNGTVNTPYSLQFAGTGGNPPYTFDLASTNAPFPVNISSAGLMTATPTTAGTYTVTVTIADTTNSQGHSFVTQDFTWTVTNRSPITITNPSPLPVATINTPYNLQLTTSGAVGTVTFSLQSGNSLPQGLSLSPTGAITGTPTATGTSSFTVLAMDSQENTGSKTFSLTVASPITITTSSPLFSGLLGTPYSTQLAATGGAGTLHWTVTSGNIPAGFQFSDTGILSGTPTAEGTSTFTVTVTDQNNASATKTFTITIGGPLTIVTTSLPDAIITLPYSQQVIAAGGTPPYNFTLTNGSLPTGLTLATDGTIAGRPTALGVSQFTVRVTDATFNSAISVQPEGSTASRALTIRVTVPIVSVVISTRALPDATVGQPYSFNVSSFGGQPPLQWSLSGFPPTFSIDQNGTIHGLPTVAGTFQVSIFVKDAFGNQDNVVLPFTVHPGNAGGLVLSPPALPSAALNTLYNVPLTVTGGTPPYNITVTGLPSPLTFTNGAITGTPTAAGQFGITVVVTDAAKNTLTQHYTLTIGSSAPQITTPSLIGGTLNAPYSQLLTATGGNPPYTWSETGALPAGIQFDPNTGVLSGTPTVSGSFPITVQVKDASGVTATRSFTLTVGNTPLQITGPLTIPVSFVGDQFNLQIATTGGIPPYTYQVTSGSLPVGTQLNTSTGVISGPLTGPGGIYPTGPATFTIQVTDAGGQTASRSFTALVLGVVTLPAQTLTQGSVGIPYKATVVASGGVTPYTFSATGLPGGLSIAADGTITGTPTAAGTSNVVITVTDNSKKTATATLPLKVVVPSVSGVSITGLPENPAPGAQAQNIGVTLGSPAPFNLNGTLKLSFTPDPTVNAQDQTIVFSNGQTSIPFTVGNGSSTGLFANGVPGLVLGTTAGTITLTPTLTDANGNPVACGCQPVTIVIPKAAPVITGVTATRNSGGFTVVVTGFSNTREVTSATFTFTQGAAGNLKTTTATVPVAAAFTTFFNDPNSTKTGTAFTLTVPFNVTGDQNSVSSVSVVLTNTVGPSQAQSTSIQ